jgi:hypothetical protein
VVSDAVDQLGRKSSAGPIDSLGIGVECEHMRGVARDAERQPAVPAAELQHATATKVGEPSQRSEMTSFRVEHRRQRELLVRSACRP